MREPKYELTDLAKWYVLGARRTDLLKWRLLGAHPAPMPPKPQPTEPPR